MIPEKYVEIAKGKKIFQSLKGRSSWPRVKSSDGNKPTKIKDAYDMNISQVL